MSANEIHYGDIGTDIILTIEDDGTAVDISAATLTECIRFKKPDGTTIDKDGTLDGDGTDGKVKYTTVDGFLDQTGRWAVQATVVIGSNEWKSDIGHFYVYPNLADPA